MLSLWDDEPVRMPDHTDRIVADATNRFAWLKARAKGVTATDVARLSSTRALRGVAMEKLLGTGFGASPNRLHLATPDGLRSNGASLELCEIKTTGKSWSSIPRSYLRQVWWQQYVLGAERTLVVWEQHDNFVPLDAEPRCKWVDRDENEIHVLVSLADRLLDMMRSGYVPAH